MTTDPNKMEFDQDTHLVQIHAELKLASDLTEIAKTTVTLPVPTAAQLDAFLRQSQKQGLIPVEVNVAWVQGHFGEDNFPIDTMEAFTELVLAAIKFIHTITKFKMNFTYTSNQ